MSLELIQVESGPALDDLRRLFREYAQSLNFNLCFESFEDELRQLPGAYSPPSGRLLLSRVDGELAGCVAIRRLEPRVCEMKRLYVRPAFRGRKLGLQMVNRLVREAREAGYSAMRLDTIAGAMDNAITLYRSVGFREIAPYSANPIEGAIYMELDLDNHLTEAERI